VVSHLVLNDFFFALLCVDEEKQKNKQEKESLRPIVSITDFLSRWILYGKGCEITRSVKHMKTNIQKKKKFRWQIEEPIGYNRLFCVSVFFF
jgi:hypothetical protein